SGAPPRTTPRAVYPLPYTTLFRSDPHAVQRAGHSRHPRPGLEDVHRACRREPDDVGEADPGAFDLPVARLAAQVRGDFVQVGDADRKSTRLNSSHVKISYAAFCLK